MSDTQTAAPKAAAPSPEDLTLKAKPIAPLNRATRDLVFECEQFLFREVRLFEEERYEEWLSTITDDIHYWMPVVQARYRRDKGERFSPKRVAHYDEDMLSLRRRITRALHPTAWAEDPPMRSANMVSNIEVELTETANEFRVYSVIINCRGRSETDEDWLMARRTDILRRGEDGELRLARREIRTTQTVLLSKNLNMLL